jgi:hypothetical protein
MASFSVVLPLVAFVAVFLSLGNWLPGNGWRTAYLRAVLLCALWLVGLTEILSLMTAIDRPTVAAGWAVLLIAAGISLAARRRAGARLILPPLRLPQAWGDRLILLGVAVVLIVTAVVAWLAPPQTWDSLNYHMPRVAHWAQDRAVEPFATGIETQNSRTPGAEYAVLHLYVLAGGDRLVNFAAWFAMLSSVIGVSLVAKQLGAGTTGQVLAAAFAASIPMGIVQASSTTTDYAVAFWMIVVASETLRWMKGPPTPATVLALGAGAGLAVFTKPTSFSYLLPFALVVAIMIVRQRHTRGLWRWVAGGALLLVAVNFAFYVRTYRLYGRLIESEQYGVHALEIHTPAVLLSNVLRNAALQMSTPSPHVNKALYLVLLKVHEVIGLDPSDPQTTSAGRFAVRPLNTFEDQTSDPLQAMFVAVVGAAAFFRPRAFGRSAQLLAAAVVAGFLIFCFVFKWQAFGSRYHLPLFVLSGPLFGVVSARGARPGVARLAGAAVLILAWPWLVGINSRPLIPGNEALVGSILTEPRERLVYANGPYLERPHRAMVQQIEGAGCARVGLMLSGNSAEYPLWLLLGAPDRRLTVEWIVAGAPSARYARSDFQPCAVICEGCRAEWTLLRDLPRVYHVFGFSLYLASPQATPAAPEAVLPGEAP